MSITNRYFLVIDDDAPVRKVLTEMLREHPKLSGWNILQSASGNEGLEIFAEHRPVLVLVDRDMPGKTGPEVTKTIKSSVPETKVIGMSGYADAEQDFRTAGADWFLKKPIAVMELWTVVNELLNP